MEQYREILKLVKSSYPQAEAYIARAIASNISALGRSKHTKAWRDKIFENNWLMILESNRNK